MSVKNCIITGGNAGMGLLCAVNLCKLNYHVTISVRSTDKGEAAMKHIKDQVNSANVDYILMDLTSLASVRSFAAEYVARQQPLHLLINNAGIMNTPFAITVDGNEEQFQVNHLSHFLLTHLLFKTLVKGSRVINLSSRAHLRWQQPLNLEDVRTVTAATYDGWQCYGRSKSCNILFAAGFAKRFPFSESGITFNSLHPGLVNTGLLTAGGLNNSTISQALTVDEGIHTCMYLATSEEVAGLTGQYFFNCRIEKNDISTFVQSEEEADKLWEGSLKMCGIEVFGQ